MTDHSPRPWQWTPKSDIDGQTVLWAGYDMIVLSSNATLLAADASLIAAAPKLLAALEALLPLAARAWAKMDEDANDYYDASRNARAAIAEARGNDG